MPCIVKGNNIRCVLHWSSSISALLEDTFFGCLNGAVGSVDFWCMLVLGGVVEVVGSNLARGKIFYIHSDFD